MYKQFSPAFLRVEEIFESRLTPPKSNQDFLNRFFFKEKKLTARDINTIYVLKNDIYSYINNYFRDVNNIMKSDMSISSKNRILDILLYDMQDSIDLFPEIFSSFEENMELSMSIYLEIGTYLNSIAQTKYKRALEQLRG